MDIFCQVIKSQIGLEPVKEHRFHPVRRWRFDYAFPEQKVAIEINGGIWKAGRHNRGQGYINDLEKLNNAAALGWLVLQFTPQQQFTSDAIDLIKKTLYMRKNV